MRRVAAVLTSLFLCSCTPVPQSESNRDGDGNSVVGAVPDGPTVGTIGNGGDTNGPNGPGSPGAPGTPAGNPPPGHIRFAAAPAVLGTGDQIADVDGDGAPDLITLSGDTPLVTVMRSRGDGTFGAAQTSNLGRGLWGRFADVDGDGHLDVLGCDANYSCAWAHGNGDGTFAAAVGLPHPGRAMWPFATDLNGDGIVDLVLAYGGNPPTPAIGVLLGDGHGGFRFVAGPDAPTLLDVGDIDGDGRADLFTEDNPVTQQTFYRNRGDGTFVAALQANFGAGSRLADANGDGRLDVLACTNSAGKKTLNVYLGAGDGTFGSPQQTLLNDVNATPDVQHDFDGDGKPDLYEGLWVHHGNGDGTFGPPQIAATQYGFVGDWNHDGKTDLLLRDAVRAFDFAAGNGDGSFVSARIMPGLDASNVSAVHIPVDIDGDGRLDVVGAGQTLLGNGDGSFHGVASGLPIGLINGLALADVDGDGRLDALIADQEGYHGAPGKLLVARGNGDGSFQSASELYPGDNPLAVAVADLDGDGALDVVLSARVLGRANGEIVVAHGDGKGGFTFGARYPLDAVFPGVTEVHTADLDRDGRMDVVSVSRDASPGVSVFRGNGDGTLTPFASYQPCKQPYDAVLADFTGDGVTDVAVACEPDSPQWSRWPGGVVVMRGMGDGSFSVDPLLPTSPDPARLQTADIDGDGHMDLVVADGGGIGVWINMGNGAFFDPLRYGPTTTFVVGDFDGDARPDIETLYWYLSFFRNLTR